MKLNQVWWVNHLIEKRNEIKHRQKLYPVHIRELLQDIYELDITVSITAKDNVGCKYNNAYVDAKKIKITKYEAEHLLSVVKTYNEEELVRIENELVDLGVEIGENEDCSDNKTFS